MTRAIEPVSVSRRLAGGVEAAFRIFHMEFGRWWPAEYTFSGPGRLETICLGADVDALCSEFGPHGFRIDWGRVIRCEPPTRLTFLWQIGPDSTPSPDPDRASEVDITFSVDGDGVLVALRHRAFERHGEGAADYREEMASAAGWPLLLDLYAGFLEQHP